MAAKKQQRLTFPHYYIFDFANEDGVISGGLRRMQTAFEISESALQYRSAVRGALEARSGSFGLLMILDRARIVFRNRLLIAPQNVYAEAFPAVQMCVRSSAMIHANQNQHGIERHRTKRIRCHAMNLAVLIHRDDGDAGRETSHGITKIILGDAHTAEDLC